MINSVAGGCYGEGTIGLKTEKGWRSLPWDSGAKKTGPDIVVTASKAESSLAYARKNLGAGPEGKREDELIEKQETGIAFFHHCDNIPLGEIREQCALLSWGSHALNSSFKRSILISLLKIAHRVAQAEREN